jgi:hypothetical protein
MMPNARLTAGIRVGTCDREAFVMERAAASPTGGVVDPRHKMFDVDVDSALAELELAWTDGGYHGFCVADGLWSAISSAGEALTGGTPDALSHAVRVHWQALQ